MKKKPSNVAYFSKIEKFFFSGPNFPNGQELKILVGNWTEELSVIYTLCSER